MAATSNTIIVNAITTAVDTMVNDSIAYHRSAAIVRGYRESGKLEDADARTYFQAALLSKAQAAQTERALLIRAGHKDAKLLAALKELGAYADQVTPRGKPAQGSAYQRAVSRMMDDTKSVGANDGTPAAALEVPANILAAAAALWKLCAEYEASAKLCATAIATVKAGK